MKEQLSGINIAFMWRNLINCSSCSTILCGSYIDIMGCLVWTINICNPHLQMSSWWVTWCQHVHITWHMPHANSCDIHVASTMGVDVDFVASNHIEAQSKLFSWVHVWSQYITNQLVFAIYMLWHPGAHSPDSRGACRLACYNTTWYTYTYIKMDTHTHMHTHTHTYTQIYTHK